MKPTAMNWTRTLLATALLCAPATPCSAFLVTGPDGRVLFANNEDFWYPETRLWCVPAVPGRRGVLYLGYDNGFPQGGLNDAGLAFDGFATAAHPMTEQDGKARVTLNPIRQAMETCSTVEEVVVLLRKIDLRPLLTNSMLFFADATGDAVIIEGDVFLRKSGDLQAVTNFYQSEHDDDKAQCRRYAALLEVLERRERTDLGTCTKALAAAAQRGPKVATLYSNVFDLESKQIHLYLFHDFEHPVTLDLATELAREGGMQRLADRFPENQRYDEFVARHGAERGQRIAARAGAPLPAATLDRYAGTYRLRAGEQDYDIVVTREEDHLLAVSEAFSGASGRRRFHSASATRFFSLDGMQEVLLRIERDAGDAAVTGFVLSAAGREFAARRVRGSEPSERDRR